MTNVIFRSIPSFFFSSTSHHFDYSDKREEKSHLFFLLNIVTQPLQISPVPIIAYDFRILPLIYTPINFYDISSKEIESNLNDW